MVQYNYSFIIKHIMVVSLKIRNAQAIISEQCTVKGGKGGLNTLIVLNYVLYINILFYISYKLLIDYNDIYSIYDILCYYCLLY